MSYRDVDGRPVDGNGKLIEDSYDIRDRIEADLRVKLAQALEERDELQATFDLQREADQRAVKRWQEAHPEKKNIWPDRADMVVWLMEKLAQDESRYYREMARAEQFKVERDAARDGSSEPGGKHEGCRYYVLDIDHDPFAIPALAGYANACEKDFPLLAEDLRRIVAVKEATDGK